MKRKVTILVVLICSVWCSALPAVFKMEKDEKILQTKVYWNRFGFKDSIWITKPDSIRKVLGDFLDMVRQLPAGEQQKAADAFTERAYSTTASRQYFADEVEYRLFNPDSPQRDDRLYMVFLRSALASSQLPEEEKSRYRFQLKNAGKNLPGNKATDFTYINKEGKRRKMSDIKSDYLVLFFYNPDCNRCRKAEQLLKKEPVLNQPSVKILAVYPGPLTKEWLEHPPTLPATWENGCSPDGEVNNRLLYFIQSTPAIYLLDKNRNVLLKDSSPTALIKYLGKKNYKMCY